jgi:hypothetical protein
MIRFVAWLAALGGAAGVVVAYGREPAHTAFAYLTAVLYWLSIALGALLLVLMSGSIGVRWIVVPRRLVELTAATLPALAALFLPVLVFMAELYSWTSDDAPHSAEVLHLIEHRAPYMNTPFFIARAVLFFAVWIGLAELMLYWSSESDYGADPELTKKQRTVAAMGLPIYALTTTFASFDWLMSLEPAFYTTSFGVYFFAGSFLAGLSAVTIVLRRASRHPSLEKLVSTSHFVSLGRLMLAFVVFWAYIAYTQFFIVWMADLPEEVSWFLPRVEGGWLGVTVFLLVAHFVMPFLILLSRDLKERPGALAWVGGWLLVCHYVDLYWLVMPVRTPAGPAPQWVDLAALVGVGGIVVLVGLWRARGRSLVARNDPGLAASVRYVAS